MKRYSIPFGFIALGAIVFPLLISVLAVSLSGDQTTKEQGDLDDIAVEDGDWPWWRGPNRNNELVDSSTYPNEWSDDSNIKWKVPIPGRGYGSPIIVGNRIILPTSREDSGSQSVLCLDRLSGETVWESVVHESGGMVKNAKSTAASSTVAFDGERLFVSFPNLGAIYTTALDLEGETIWQKKISDYIIHQGYGASPTLYRNLVIVVADNKGGGKLIALDRQTGETIWERGRPSAPNYPSPAIVRIQDSDQLILTGCDQVVSYQPLTGETIWEVDGATTECVTTTVTNGRLVFSSGGYPRNHLAAYRADAGGELVWETNDRVYVPSLLLKEDALFAVTDNGIAICWNVETGSVNWKARLGGEFTASPLLVNGQIYATNESGQTFIFDADPAAFQLTATNQLSGQVFATPTPCRGELFFRIVETESELRQEHLICIQTN